MHYYQKNIGDYRAATAHLTLLEHGVYNWLIDTYYSNEQPLPLDERVLFRMSLARSEDEKQAVRDILDEFFIKTDAGCPHKFTALQIKWLLTEFSNEFVEKSKSFKFKHEGGAV